MSTPIVVIAGATAGVLLAGLLTWLRRGWVLVTVEGRSMVPALNPGDRVLVRRTRPTGIRIDQVVVVEEPVAGRWDTPALTDGATPLTRRRWIVKRAVAGPGDPVPAEVVVTIGAGAGSQARDGSPDYRAPARVPAGHFVLLGDNRDGSVDSRAFGLVPARRILGPVRRRLRAT